MGEKFVANALSMQKLVFCITTLLLAAVCLFPAPARGVVTLDEFATATGNLLNPDKLFETLKKNITVSLPTSTEKQIKVPSPEEALKEASPKLQEINRGVKEEVGIDFSKLIGWFAKILKVITQIVIDLLEKLSGILKS